MPGEWGGVIMAQWCKPRREERGWQRANGGGLYGSIVGGERGDGEGVGVAAVGGEGDWGRLRNLAAGLVWGGGEETWRRVLQRRGHPRRPLLLGVAPPGGVV